MNIRSCITHAPLFYMLLLVPHRLAAQTIGSLSSDRARLVEIAGNRVRAESLLVRHDSIRVLMPTLLARRGTRVTLVQPSGQLIWNSAIPHSLNDGSLWAGRGWNATAQAGVAISQRHDNTVVRVAFVPTLFASQNLPFQILPNTTPGRSTFANPHHGPEASLDWPLRFGDERLLGFDLGASDASVEWPHVTVGATTSNEWWGPGIRTALVMSNNAPGIPRFYVRNTRPVRTPFGTIDGELISGVLTQSRFFDSTASENRSLSALRIELRPAFDTGLTIGFTRVVYAPIGDEASPFTATLSRAVDALARWENLSVPGDQRSDQIGSIFIRSVFPASGIELYAEWARMALPLNPAELLTAPHYTGAWTFGGQWLSERGAGRYLRLQSEVSYLEQSVVFPDRATPDFYAGYGSPQGYTQRGQIIGAATGPGSSSQWLAGDWITRDWQAGVFVGRVRWDNDAMYRRTATFFDHDVSLLGGVRGGWRAPHTDISAELTMAHRFNYLFQNGRARPGGYRTVDVNNITLALVATPR